MNPQNIIRTTVSLLFSTYTLMSGQPTTQDSCALPVPGEAESATENDADPDKKAPASFKIWKGLECTGGQLTLPFKIRPKAETHSFRLTTDVTVGAYVGLTKRLSASRDFFLTIPLAAGLTFINLNDNNTSLDLDLQEAEVVPGLTWSTGIILQLEKYSLGFMFGKDYASEVGDQWEYHRRIWWSFGIGFTFFH